ncbi:MAG: prolipoprotein diacylglyceryl transferase family protein, partial [Candidatus Hydrogenedentales bacterium]
LGCFLNGCCYGKVSDVPWAMPFRRVPWDTSVPPEGSPPYLDHLKRFGDQVTTHDHWSLPIHPTQLYSFLGLMALCCIMLLLRRYWNPYTGFMMPLYFILYGIFRFIVEFFRGDHNPVHFGFTDQQLFSVVLIAAGIALYHYLKRRAARRAPAA